MFRRDILVRFDIKYEDWNFYKASRVETRGNSSRSDQEIKEQSFQALLQTKFRDMSFGEMHEYLLEEKRKREASNFETFGDFQQYYLTPEGSKFYYDLFGYDGDAGGSAEGIVEYYSLLDTEFTGYVIRPEEGMVALIRALAKSAEKLGAKIFAGSDYEIIQIRQDSSGFVLESSKEARATATKLVIAVPPSPFKKIGGTLALNIQHESTFQSLKPFPAFKAAAVYSRAWWEDITAESKRLHPMEGFLSNSDCLGWTLPHRLVEKKSPSLLFIHVKGLCK